MEAKRAEVDLLISKRHVILEEGDGYTEQSLLRRGGKLYENIPYYIAAHCVSIDGQSPVTYNHIKTLYVAEKEQLLFEIFKLNNIDSMLTFGVTCPAPECGCEYKVTIDVNDIEIRQFPDEVNKETASIVGVLPRSNQEVEIGALTVEKELLIMAKSAMGDTDLNYVDYLSIRKLGGRTDFTYEDIMKLRAADHRVIRRLREKLVCGYDPDVKTQCPDCGKRDVVNIFSVRDFLFWS